MATSTTIPKLLTVGRIAVILLQPVHRIAYVLRTRGHIRPSALAGQTRLYDQQAVAQIRHEINAIDARRCERGVSSHA